MVLYNRLACDLHIEDRECEFKVPDVAYLGSVCRNLAEEQKQTRSGPVNPS